MGYSSGIGELLGALCLIIVIFLFGCGVSIAEISTYDVVSEYTVEAVVKKVDYIENYFGLDFYKIYAITEDDKVYYDYIREDKYLFTNVGDQINFKVTEAHTCFGDSTTIKYFY